MKAIIDYLDREVLKKIVKYLTNEEKIIKRYPIKFKKEKNVIKFTGFDDLKLHK